MSCTARAPGTLLSIFIIAAAFAAPGCGGDSKRLAGTGGMGALAAKDGGDSTGGATGGGGTGGRTSQGATGGTASGGAVGTGGHGAGGGMAGPAAGQCGNTLCAAGMSCCNASCGTCTSPGDGCTKQLCVSPPCDTDADCQPTADYCTGCDCRSLAKGESLPTCSGPGVRCLVDPCMARVAHCVSRRCVLAPKS